MTFALTMLTVSTVLASLAARGAAAAEPAAAALPSAATVLTVAVTGSAPFVNDADGAGGYDPKGIAVDLWRQVARRGDLRFRLVPFDNADSALEALTQNTADVAVGPLSATSQRAQRVSFCQPFFQARLGIAAPEAGLDLWQRVAPFLSAAFLGGLIAFLLILVGVGAALWLAERGSNADFPKNASAGIGVGVWLAMVTMTTVGYGDKAPHTPRGRFIAGVWMLVSMISVSSLTAFLATAATLAGLSHPSLQRAEDLRGRRVAVVDGTTGADFARRRGARVVAAADLDAALDRVEAGEADAVVFDRPALRWRLSQRGNLAFVLSPHGYEPVGYAFATRHGDPLHDTLDAILLELAEEDATASIVERWLGPASD